MFCAQAYECGIDGVVSFEANPDIAGIGVTLAFSISAGIAYVAVIVAYIFVDPFEPASNNFYDDIVRLPIQKLAGRLGLHKHVGGPRTKKAVQRIAVILSDQQLITGASILIVGFAQHCTITQYHYAIVDDLSWVAYCTIEATIHIAESEYRQNPAMRLWRAIWVVGLFLSLLASSLITNNAAFLNQFGMSTQCAWDNLANPFLLEEDNVVGNITEPVNGTLIVIESVSVGPQDQAAMMLVDLLLLWGLATMLQTLYRWKWRWLDKAKQWVETFLRLPLYLDRLCALGIQSIMAPQTATSSRLKPGKAIALGVLWLTRVLSFPGAILMITLGGLLRSKILNYIRLFVLMIFSIKDIFSLKAEAADQGMQGDEDVWGFGQLLPLLLLALPLTSIFETFESTFFGGKRAPADSSTASKDCETVNQSTTRKEVQVEIVVHGSLPRGPSLTYAVLALEARITEHFVFAIWIQIFTWGIFTFLLLLAFKIGYAF